MITKIDIGRVSIPAKGWAFSVHYDNRPFANFVSAVFKTKAEACEQAAKYRETGKFVFYGSAEMEVSK